jgi:hypothetical protein
LGRQAVKRVDNKRIVSKTGSPGSLPRCKPALVDSKSATSESFYILFDSREHSPQVFEQQDFGASPLKLAGAQEKRTSTGRLL